MGQTFSFCAEMPIKKKKKKEKRKKEINQKTEKTFPRYIFLMVLAKFWRFLSKNVFFLPLLKILGQKITFFDDFSKIRFLTKNLTI